MFRNTLAAFAASSFLCAGSALAGERAIIVLDASGSMWGQIEGKTKIEIARETLGDVLSTIPADLELGLIAYGHRRKGQCSDIEQIVAPAAGTSTAIAASVHKLNPKGKTPLTDAVRQAAESLRYTEDKATVILVTDGIETCEADPCAVASELERAGVDFTAHVVGFGLQEGEGVQVSCIAENTGGVFLEADDAAELTDALTKTVAAAPPVPEPEPEPAALEDNVTITARLAEGAADYDLNGRYDYFPMEDDTPAAKSVVGGYDTTFTATLEPGRYLLRYKKDMAGAETVIEVTGDEKIERDLVLGAGVISVAVLPDDGAEPDTAGRFDILAFGAKSGGYGSGTLVVPAGDVVIEARLGKGDLAESLTLAPGEIVERDLVLGIGIVRANAVYAAGGPAVETSGLRVDVFSARKALDGTRKDFGGGYGPGNEFKLPPGDYVVRARLDKAVSEAPVTVARGGATDVVVDLNAGVLAISVPGAYRIDVFAAKPDLQGKRTDFGGTYGETFQTTLHPGDYAVVATMGDSKGEKKEMPASVMAAERTEVMVE
ncbi:vWA domain-containing protein [Oricola cellulosilytica]|uniref:VWA domain-containing protein n=1 Tax=Oricola cellulosilytica TaxID=1429082 RepID=A0A4R0PG98_9HYPH|nr:VWA domain-containing protein [Oricola cellulosilytica]TCD14494.1 VWA domain-containing protein [Oricola cellulosilytica]